MIHHDSALCQKAGAAGLRTGSLSRVDVFYLSPGIHPEFPPSSLSPASSQIIPKCSDIYYNTNTLSLTIVVSYELGNGSVALFWFTV